MLTRTIYAYSPKRRVLGNAPRRAVATLRLNGRPTEKEYLLITPVRVSATFS